MKLTKYQVAQEFDISSWTLHKYIKLGWVRPAYGTGRRYRYYTEDHLEDVRRVVVARESNFSVMGSGDPYGRGNAYKARNADKTTSKSSEQHAVT